MGVFDKIKGAVVNAAGNAKAVYEQAAAMDLESLCAAMKELKLIDPKLIAYRAALNNKLDAMSDQQLDQFYGWIKKQGNILKKHPGQETVENELVRRNMYVRDEEDGTISRNTFYRRNW